MSVGVPPRTSPRAVVRRPVELAADGLPLPRVARTTAVANLSTAASIAMSLGMFAAAPLRGRPDEIIAGVFALAVSIGLGLRVSRAGRAARALPVLAALGWAIQLFAVLVYYYTEIALDAAAYHGLAARYASGAEPLIWPEANWGVEGIAATLSLVYRVTGPSMLLGFALFGAMGLAGKLLVARALLDVRDVLGDGGEAGAVLLVVLPSLNIWLAAISKESIAVLGIGLVAGGLIRRGRPPNAVMMAAGLVSIAIVRAHIALLLSAAVVAYQVITVALPRRQGGGRVLPLIAGGILAAGSLVTAAAYLGTGTGIDELEARRLELSTLSDVGGSNVTAAPITSPAQIPPALANVLLRPYPWEAYNLTTRAQAAENVLLITGLVWLAAQGRRRRRNPQVGANALRLRAMRLFGSAYVGGFIFAFSVTYNLGLVSRQRAQLWLPAAVLIATAFARVGRGPGAAPVRTGATSNRSRAEGHGRTMRPQPARRPGPSERRGG
jgi:hypothetical protein